MTPATSRPELERWLVTAAFYSGPLCLPGMPILLDKSAKGQIQSSTPGLPAPAPAISRYSCGACRIDARVDQ